MEGEVIFRIVIVGLTIGCIYALIAVGLNLVWGTMRILNLAHGQLIMFGAYTAYWLFTLYGASSFLSALLAIVWGTALGFILYRVLFSTSLRTMVPDDLENYSLLIFFGFLIILENIACLAWTADIRACPYVIQSITILGTPIGLNRLLAAVVAIGICLAFYIFLQRTLFGKAVRAVIQDRDATQLVGVDIDKIYMFCFCMGFAMAGLAGALLAMFYSISPFMGSPYTMMALVVVVLGGVGNILGSLMGGLLLGLVMTAGTALTSPGFSFIFLYLLFILTIFFMPAGILGRRLR